MGGHVGIDEIEPLAGSARGQRENTPLLFDVEIRIEDLGRFLRVADHAAQLSGTVTFEPLGGRIPSGTAYSTSSRWTPGPDTAG